jgi:23S rRNA (guanosine2251-2'-O)-methyltransferase
MADKKTSRQGSGRRDASRTARPLHADGGPDLLFGSHSAVAALANTRRRIRRVLVTRNAAERLADVLRSRTEPAPEIVEPRALDRLTGPDAVHQGIVVEADPLPQPRLDQIERGGPVVLLDQVTDPHNVGAILRSCAAFGARALVTTARHSPLGSAVLFKAASGALEHVPFVKVTNLARAMEELRGYGFLIIGLDSAGEIPIETAARPGVPTALVLGAEGKGLRRLTRDTCDAVARLDLPGPLHSLNVSVACALGLYALSRLGPVQ